MIMKLRSIFFVFIVITFFSCKKESSNDDGNTVAASTILNAAYGSDPLQKMDVYLPADRSIATTKVIVLIHGGAYFSEDKADFTKYVDTIKRRLPTYAIFNINYRLYTPPLNTFPAQELDVKAAVEYIAAKSAEYLIGNKFVLMGASAGAHLALLQAYKNNSPVKVNAVVDFFGPTDIKDLYDNPGIIPSADIAAVVGGTPASNPDIYQQSSPVNFVSAASACPTIILQGSADPLISAQRQSAALRDKLQIAGVPVQYVLYAGKGHGDDWDNANFKDAFDNIQSFLTTYNQ